MNDNALPLLRSSCHSRGRYGLVILASLLFLGSIARECSASPCWTFPGFDEYSVSFISHWSAARQIPSEPPLPGDYVAVGTYYRLYTDTAVYFADAIAQNQNQQAGMAWGSSYHMQSLNDMFRATRDPKYLESNLLLARASMAATDKALGRVAIFGEISPCWGTGHYREDGGYTVHLAHTGMIAWPILEFLWLSEPYSEALGLTHLSLFAALPTKIPSILGVWVAKVGTT